MELVHGNGQILTISVKAAEDTTERNELQDLQERLDSKIRVSLCFIHYQLLSLHSQSLSVLYHLTFPLETKIKKY